MKLHYSKTSPYVRKVMIVARESGLLDRLELSPQTVLPTEPNAAIAADNPLMKVPTLILDDGTALYDSRVIAEFLDSTAGGTLFPMGPQRWAALRRQALADGILDASILIRYERTLRPPEKLFEAWVDGQLRKIRGALDMLEDDAGRLGGDLTIGQIAIGCALGYLDFRFGEEEWRNTRPRLAGYYAELSQLPSFRETQPS